MSAEILESYLATNPAEAAVAHELLERLESDDQRIKAQATGDFSALCVRAAEAGPQVTAQRLGDGKLLERLGKFMQSPLGKTLMDLFLGALIPKATT